MFLVEMRDARASASTFSGKMRGNWCLRIIISTSTPKSSGAENSMTRPIGGRVGVGQLVISTSTTRPSKRFRRSHFLDVDCASRPKRDAAWDPRRQAESPRRGMRMGCVMRSSKGMTTLLPRPDQLAQ
jgi:hypothetical protein